MELLFAFVAGMVLAGIVAVIVLRSVKSNALASQAKALEDAAKQAEAEKKADMAQLQADLENARRNLEQTKADEARHAQELLSAKEAANKEALETLEKTHKEAMAEMERRHTDAIVAEQKRMEQALATAKEQMQNAANQMLRDRQADFQRANSTHMEQIVNPLKETISKMEAAINNNKTTQENSATSIESSIKTLVQTTLRMQDSADRLSNALTAESKTQGNWGEQKIESLLNAIGLERGLEYDIQEYLRDDNGDIIVSDETSHRMQPDVILHLDETRDLIIDSKVSLSAFVEYNNAKDDEEAQKIALAAHLKSVRNHVKELAKKNYASYVKTPRQSVDFVMMFVPIDPALQLALASDPTLWRDAMNQGVFIVGEQNLYAALRAVQVTWTAIKQNANNKAICDTAEELINRVGDLLEKVQKLGKKLDEANSAYGEVVDKAKEGRQNVLGSARKLVKLGAKNSTKHPLPKGQDEDEDGDSDALPEHTEP